MWLNIQILVSGSDTSKNNVVEWWICFKFKFSRQIWKCIFNFNKSFKIIISTVGLIICKMGLSVSNNNYYYYSCKTAHLKNWCKQSQKERYLMRQDNTIYTFSIKLCFTSKGMCYPICGMVHIKEPLLLIGKSIPCGSSRCSLSLSEWSFTICPTPCNHK